MELCAILSESVRYCSPKCEFFQCGQRAKYFKGEKVFCRWADDECHPTRCNYASCIRGRLLANGVCGLTVRRKTIEKEAPEEILPAVKLRSRVLRRINETDLY